MHQCIKSFTLVAPRELGGGGRPIRRSRQRGEDSVSEFPDAHNQESNYGTNTLNISNIESPPSLHLIARLIHYLFAFCYCQHGVSTNSWQYNCLHALPVVLLGPRYIALIRFQVEVSIMDTEGQDTRPYTLNIAKITRRDFDATITTMMPPLCCHISTQTAKRSSNNYFHSNEQLVSRSEH
jgi:hypothetical protein